MIPIELECFGSLGAPESWIGVDPLHLFPTFFAIVVAQPDSSIPLALNKGFILRTVRA